MVFFIALLIITGVAWCLGRLGAKPLRPLRDIRACMRLALAGALVFFGTDHLLTPDRYLPMIETWLPWPEAIVAFTGMCEIAGGLGLLIPGVRRWAGIALALYFVAVFPANVYNALHGLSVAGLPEVQWYYWARLGFQPIAVWWALYSAQVIRWPFAREQTVNRQALTKSRQEIRL